jgi:hypothetical protein
VFDVTVTLQLFFSNRSQLQWRIAKVVSWPKGPARRHRKAVPATIAHGVIHMHNLNTTNLQVNATLKGIGRNISDKGYEARIALDAETRRDAYALRYKSYHAHGSIPANPTGLFSDKYDELPTVTTVVVYADGKAVGSVRTCLLRRGPGTTSPARDLYPTEVEALLQGSGPERSGFDGLEVNRMVRAPEAEDDQGLVFMLYRLSGRLAMSADFRVVMLCARNNHVPFYRRMRFREAAEPRVYPGLTCQMVLLQSSRQEWDAMREGFRLMDPEAGPEGLLDGLEQGRAVRPHLVYRV